MKIISFLLKHSRGTFLLALGSGVLSGVASTGLLALINAALGSTGAGRDALLVPFVLLCMFAPVARIVSEFLLIRLGQRSVYNLRLGLTQKILGIPLRQMEELGGPRIMAALTDDVFAITNAIIFIPIVCINAAAVIGCLVYMGWLSWTLLLAVMAAIVVGVISYQLPIMKATQYFGRAREEEDHLFGHFRALVDGFKELKMHGGRRQSFVSEQMAPTAASFRDNNVMGMAIYSVAANWGQLLVFIVIGLLVFLMPRLVGVEVPALTGFTIAILYITTPLQVIMNSVPELGRASVALDKIEQLGLSLVSDEGDGQADAARAALPAAGAGARLNLEAADLTHTYYVEGEANNFKLGPVNLNFRPGEIVFLTGGNGSGKTTFAKLLTGLYEPEAGEVRLDGKAVGAEARDAYRQLFSVVFADFYLFDSLLGLGSHELDGRAREYLSQLQLGHKVQVVDGKLSTTALSQGQRKRLALLTAYLEDRPVYLFDEWAADQDPVFKEVFYLRLLPELKARGKTVFVISHDDHYYFVADRVIKFDYGQVESDVQGAAARYAANGGGGVAAGAKDLV